jgi:hypothetical protein
MSERLAAPQVLADYFHNLSHNDPQQCSIASLSQPVLYAPPLSRKLPTEAKTTRNSFV